MKAGKKKGPKIEIKEEQNVPKCIMTVPQGLRLVIGAKPNSKTSKVMEINDQYLGVAIAAPPKEGQANEELVCFLAQSLGVKKNTVSLDKGCRSKHKVVIVANQQISLEQAYQRLKWDMEN